MSVADGFLVISGFISSCLYVLSSATSRKFHKHISNNNVSYCYGSDKSANINILRFHNVKAIICML